MVYDGKPSKSEIEAGKGTTQSDGSRTAAEGERANVDTTDWTAGWIKANMYLLGGGADDPAKLAQGLVEDFAKMPEDKLNAVTELLEKEYRVKVKRDQDGRVESLSQSQHRWYEDGSRLWSRYHPTISMLYSGPSLYRNYNRGSGEDVTITLKDGKVDLEARQYWDVTGKGILTGSNKISAPVSRDPDYKPAWTKGYCKYEPTMDVGDVWKQVCKEKW